MHNKDLVAQEDKKGGVCMRGNSSMQSSQIQGRSSAGKQTSPEQLNVDELEDLYSAERQMLKVLLVVDGDRYRIARFHAGMWWEQG